MEETEIVIQDCQGDWTFQGSELLRSELYKEGAPEAYIQEVLESFAKYYAVHQQGKTPPGLEENKPRGVGGL